MEKDSRNAALRAGPRIALTVGLWLLAGAGVCGETPFVSLPGHVSSALATATLMHSGRTSVASDSTATADEPLTLTIVLRRADEAGFQRYLHDVYDPGSPIFRQFLTPLQVAERFGPSADDYQSVRTYFATQGFVIGDETINRMTLTARGSRAAVTEALGVTTHDYQIGARTFYANDQEPSLPVDIAARVQAVVGLSTLAQPAPNIDTAKKVLCFVIAQLNNLLGYTQYGPDGTPIKVYSPGQAGLADKLYKNCMIDFHADGYGNQAKADPPPPAWQGADGSGQKIGVVAFDTFLLSDVSDFITIAGLSASTNNVSTVHVGGGATPGANADEVLLDIDTILSIAPAAKIAVYDGPFSGANASFQAIFNAMVNDGVDIISNSWAYCEDQTTLADVQSIDAILQTAAASGIGAFTGTGDRGSACLDGAAHTVHVPADSPHITAVGGTTLTLGPGHTYQSETWWDSSAASPPGGSGGFGASVFFLRPAYQNGATASATRSIPDLVSSADPVTGGQICQASAGGCPSGLLYGGTSKSAPAWAAFAAQLNQTQGSKLGFLNPLLYPLANTDAFHNAASMGTDFNHVGLGSPNLSRLHTHLTGQTPGSADANVSIVEAFSGNSGFSSPNKLGLPVPNIADGASKSYVVVRLTDALGNIVVGKTVSLSASPSTGVAISPPSGVSKVDNGAVIFTITGKNQGTVTFTATDTTDNVVLTDKPQTAFLVPPATSAGLVASPTSVPPDGVTTTTLTVMLKDINGDPTPAKEIAIDQGSGHSIIIAPNPPTTDLNGQIQFTATNGVSEIVTYTAIDVTDGNLRVPQTATVDFAGVATSCAAPIPTAGAGYVIGPWATGFFAQSFFYGNVNWGGCPGASNPTFTPAGTALVADFRTGDLFRFGLDGGSSAGKLVSNLNPTLGQPTFGKDGRLYATHGATTGNFFTGDIVEVDPVTGAQLRVVASNLVCPNGLSVDPLSGDLFFDDECFGAGSDNPSLWRIQDPANTAVLSVYATLPATPNGQLAFAPDGTMFAETGYNSIRQVVRVSGTDKPSPPTVTTVTGITSLFCLTMGEAQNNGAAKSLIVCDSNGLELVDITTNPVSAKLLLSGGQVSSGVIGPDGCLYTAGEDTIYKLSPATGGCGFVPTNPAPAIALTPGLVSPNPAQGTAQSFTATFIHVSVPAATPVLFNVTGANPQTKIATTDASGGATISYVGVFTGTDSVTASATVGSTSLVSNTALVTWNAGKHLTFLNLAIGPSSGTAGQSTTLRVSLSDATLDPLGAIAGAPIHLTLGLQSCDATTNGQGVASCVVAVGAPGLLALTATYAGSGLYTSASATRSFFVLAAEGTATSPGPPTITGAIPGDRQITVLFDPPTSDGGSAITSYAVTCTPVGGGPGIVAIATQTSLTVAGLTNGVTYRCTVTAANAVGNGSPSAASAPVTPFASAATVQAIPTLDRFGALLLVLMLSWVATRCARRAALTSRHR